MAEADKFWKQSFPETERTAPSVFFRLAFPINDKTVFKLFEDLLQKPGFSELKLQG